MFSITTGEKFLEATDGIKIEKKWKPIPMCIVQIKKQVGTTIVYKIVNELLESEVTVNKDPETPKKMALIYQLIQSDYWMKDETIVQKVQKLAETII